MQEQEPGPSVPPEESHGFDIALGLFAGGVPWPLLWAVSFADAVANGSRDQFLSDRGWQTVFWVFLVAATLLYAALARRWPHFARAALAGNILLGAWSLYQSLPRA